MRPTESNPGTHDALSTTLNGLMRRPKYRVTPGLLSKLSGIPRATIINWLEGRVVKPRHSNDLLTVADALRLNDDETDALLVAAGHPPRGVLETKRSANARAETLQSAHRAARLPRQMTELIGRDAAVDAVRKLLQLADTRLVSLVGTGGVGKTHLAIAAAEGLRESFRDGIIWVSLAGVGDPAQVVSTIAQAVGIIETNTTSALRLLSTALAASEALLVIDNFEHVLIAAPRLVELLEQTTALKVLVTSRAALHMRGEREFRVVPLDIPDLNHLPATGALTKHSAVALFVARAQIHHADFAPTDENAADIAAICARVDGLPLGLELAAARTGVLPPGVLLSRLGSRLTLLTGGPRDRGDRQHTMRNTIAWSYALLSDEQRHLFRHLAILSGGISFAAAAAVAGVDVTAGSPSNTFFDILAALVDQSLLSVEAPRADREPRFVMLETIREYALELLVEHDEIRSATVRHAAHFLELAEEADAVFAIRPTSLTLQNLQPEHANLLAALKWFFEETADMVSAARLAAALSRYWFDRGLFQEARVWLELISQAEHGPDDAMTARIKLYLAFAANYESDYVSGGAIAEAAFAAYTRVGDRMGAAQATNAMGIAAMFMGQHRQAEQLFSRALRAYRDANDRRGIAVALHNLGEIASEFRLDFTAARAHFEESLELFRTLGHTMNVGSTLGVFAETLAHQGMPDEASRLGREALATYQMLDNQPLIARELARLARYELAMNNDAEARTSLAGAASYLKMTFNPRDIADFFETFAQLALRVGRLELAAAFLGFSDFQRERYRIPRYPAWEGEQERLVVAIRSHMSEALYGQYWNRGRRLDLAKAIEEAVQL